jgi:hypothetical protein
VNVFLITLSAFNLFAAVAACGAALRLHEPEERARWTSARLYFVALILAWGLPMCSALGTAAAWMLGRAAAPLVLAPVAWLLFMGVVFAVVDVAEDGVMDFGRKPKSP